MGIIRNFRRFFVVSVGTLIMAAPGLANMQIADNLARAGRYDEAAKLYYQVYTAHTTESVRAEWFLAQSLEKLGLLNAASRYYSVIVRRGDKPGNIYFKSAMEQLGKINARVSLGQAHIIQLFRTKINAADVPGAARGFYFYYKGVEFFNDNMEEKARDAFEKVPSDSTYYNGAVFHIGVIDNLRGNRGSAIAQFEKVLRATRDSDSDREIRENALMNLARVNYEEKRYPEAISYYGQIPRDSEHWLDAIWETSWAFFFMEKFNNTLGQIHTLHSPFFINRFYPESYILQAITFLRMCRYDEVKSSMHLFKDRYNKVFKALKAMLNQYSGNPRGMFTLVYEYSRGEKVKYEDAEEIIKKLSMLDAFAGARDTIRFSDREIEALAPYRSKWESVGLYAQIKSFLVAKKAVAIRDAGQRMHKLATNYYTQLLDLSQQTKMIVAEMQLGKLESLRAKISSVQEHSKVEFIGGMKKLNIGQSLEYWPFDQEYWEDELGYYVYNMNSKCSKPKDKDK